jgi:hypothetical protein
VTVKVYEVPPVKPLTVQDCVPVGGVEVFATVQVNEPGVEVTVYSVDRPSAVKVTLTAPAPAFATVGAATAAEGVNDAEAGEAVAVVEPPLGVTTNV